MEAPSIDLTRLARAQATLVEALQLWSELPEGVPLKRHLRASVIQSFEFVYELSIRSLRRVSIERAVSTSRAADLSFNDLLRLGADAGLLANPERWRVWRELRNATSHAYNEAKAEAVAKRAPEFALDADLLRATLEAGIGH